MKFGIHWIFLWKMFFDLWPWFLKNCTIFYFDDHISLKVRTLPSRMIYFIIRRLNDSQVFVWASSSVSCFIREIWASMKNGIIQGRDVFFFFSSFFPYFPRSVIQIRLIFDCVNSEVNCHIYGGIIPSLMRTKYLWKTNWIPSTICYPNRFFNTH
jgi:hypothetical protein